MFSKDDVTVYIVVVKYPALTFMRYVDEKVGSAIMDNSHDDD